jgi:hypothetical protein
MNKISCLEAGVFLLGRLASSTEEMFPYISQQLKVTIHVWLLSHIKSTWISGSLSGGYDNFIFWDITPCSPLKVN